MRASFITYMKDHTDCPKILAAAARAMKHKGETQGSDHYDSARPRRLAVTPSAAHAVSASRVDSLAARLSRLCCLLDLALESAWCT